MSRLNKKESTKKEYNFACYTIKYKSKNTPIKWKVDEKYKPYTGNKSIALKKYKVPNDQSTQVFDITVNKNPLQVTITASRK